jgi:hypothetical protein
MYLDKKQIITNNCWSEWHRSDQHMRGTRRETNGKIPWSNSIAVEQRESWPNHADTSNDDSTDTLSDGNSIISARPWWRLQSANGNTTKHTFSTCARISTTSLTYTLDTATSYTYAETTDFTTTTELYNAYLTSSDKKQSTNPNSVRLRNWIRQSKRRQWRSPILERSQGKRKEKKNKSHNHKSNNNEKE